MTGKELGALPAHPCVELGLGSGFSKREQLAAMMMQAIMYDASTALTMTFERVAFVATQAADALLEELAK
jgi:hypothetical protein